MYSLKNGSFLPAFLYRVTLNMQKLLKSQFASAPHNKTHRVVYQIPLARLQNTQELLPINNSGFVFGK